MTSTVRAAARKTATATKVYIHVDCTCARVNGTVLKEIGTVAAAEAYATEQGFATTFCKTSVKPAAVEAPVVEEAPVVDEPAPIVEAPVAEDVPVVVEEPAVEAPVVEESKAAPKKRAPKKDTEEAPVAEGSSFEVEVNNKDQYGKQRRTAVETIALALGATTTYASVKNKHKTGNDAFIVTVTGGKDGIESIIREFVATTDAELVEVVAEAKAAAKVEGATANDIQKAWKKAARDHITAAGEALAAKVAGR